VQAGLRVPGSSAADELRCSRPEKQGCRKGMASLRAVACLAHQGTSAPPDANTADLEGGQGSAAIAAGPSGRQPTSPPAAPECEPAHKQAARMRRMSQEPAPLPPPGAAIEGALPRAPSYKALPRAPSHSSLTREPRATGVSLGRRKAEGACRRAACPVCESVTVLWGGTLARVLSVVC
jgi:hypothetical protein